jgi:pimeloyl-ACP methyl ester carboxylesterase
MTDEITRPVPTRMDKDGVPYAETRLSPVDNKVRAQAVVPPSTVVPIVFVPGVMGSNLKAESTIKVNGGVGVKAGDRVWNVDSLTSPMSWWGKSPDYRQLVLNNDAVTVDNRGKIGEGTQPKYSNDGVVPVVTQVPTGETELSKLPLELARKRGWGSVSWQYYGPFLDWLQYQLSEGRITNGQPNNVFQSFMDLVGTSPRGAQIPAVLLTVAQAKKMLNLQFPVHAVGYNWLQSNMDSGRDLTQGVNEGANRVLGIDDIIKLYDNVRGQTCKEVIVVTHSMGGLVARAAALAHGAKILGIVHGVQPIDGAAAFYKRIAAGFEAEGSGIKGHSQGYATAKILGPDSRYTIPELAYNPGPLELAPNQLYNGGKPWLFIKDRQGRVLKALPESGDPYQEIYLDTTHVWRAVNPEWLNPAGAVANPEIEFGRSIGKAKDYHTKLGGKVHPKTYAHWGADAGQKSWGAMTWTAEAGETYMPSAWDVVASQGVATPQWLPDREGPTAPEQWSFQAPVAAAGTERDLLSAQKREIHMTVDDPSNPGDGTVPAKESGAQIARYPGCQIACALTGFDHQGDYNDPQVRKVLLDALVRIVEPVIVT